MNDRCKGEVNRELKCGIKQNRIDAFFVVVFICGLIVFGSLFFSVQAASVKAADTGEISYVWSVEEAGEIMRTAILNRDETVVIGFGVPLSSTSIRKVYTHAVSYVSPDMENSAVLGDYLDASVKQLVFPLAYKEFDPVKKKYIYEYQISYYDTKEQEEAVEALLQEFKEFIGLTPDRSLSEAEKVKLIYDGVCDMVRYDDGATTGNLRYTAYGALSNKKAVCLGYAALMYRALMSEGIACHIVKGELRSAKTQDKSAEKHAWNVVKIDGNYYAIDATLDAKNQERAHFLDCDLTFKDVNDADDYFPENVDETGIYTPLGGESIIMNHTCSTVEKMPTKESKGSRIEKCTKCGRELSKEILIYWDYHKLPKVKLTKCVPKKRRVDVYFKRTNETVKTVSGYQIQYARKQSFRGGKIVTVQNKKQKKQTIRKLKAKQKYYFRIRTYKKMENKTYYSNWSGKKCIKTK